MTYDARLAGMGRDRLMAENVRLRAQLEKLIEVMSRLQDARRQADKNTHNADGALHDAKQALRASSIDE